MLTLMPRCLSSAGFASPERSRSPGSRSVDRATVAGLDDHRDPVARPQSRGAGGGRTPTGADMSDSSSRPLRSPARTRASMEPRVVQLRRTRRLGAVQIVGRLGLAASTVHVILTDPGRIQPARLNRPGHRAGDPPQRTRPARGPGRRRCEQVRQRPARRRLDAPRPRRCWYWATRLGAHQPCCPRRPRARTRRLRLPPRRRRPNTPGSPTLRSTTTRQAPPRSGSGPEPSTSSPAVASRSARP